MITPGLQEVEPQACFLYWVTFNSKTTQFLKNQTNDNNKKKQPQNQQAAKLMKKTCELPHPENRDNVGSTGIT